ncbi:MAG: LPS export ABC transporter periplasmic protein LptC [Rhodanobacter sp.]|jgi:lipopolysaccharide export system protein LptC|nr:LPS export ABC transporter periplasmic protein LptC [Rhodanobacter sp.]
MNRRYWMIVTVLAILAIASEILVWYTRERPNEQIFAGPPRSDYTATDFTLDALDIDGRRTFRIRGPWLARRGEDGSVFVTTPDYDLIDSHNYPWQGKSDSAWISEDGTMMKLLGHVEMHRAADSNGNPLDIITRDVTAWPKEKKVETTEFATISQPRSILWGVGMRGDLDTKVLELLSNVHSVMEPQHANP